MKKFEYILVYLPFDENVYTRRVMEEYLNKKGQKGWELVSMIANGGEYKTHASIVGIFKREISE